MKTFFATYTYTCMDLIFQEKRLLGCHSLLLFRLDSIFSSPVLEAELAGSGGESPAHPGARRSLVPEDERSGAGSRPDRNASDALEHPRHVEPDRDRSRGYSECSLFSCVCKGGKGTMCGEGKYFPEVILYIDRDGDYLLENILRKIVADPI